MARDLRKEHSFYNKLKVWFGSDGIIVLTMGKVGTLTVCNSLEHAGFRSVHPHSLFFTRPGVHFIDIALSPRQRLWYAYKTVTKRLKVALWRLLSSEILIITGVRDPFSRAISAYFEQSHYFGGVPECWDYDEIKDDLEMRTFFNATTSWFDKEIRRFSGIDVLESDFDPALGYKTYRKGKIRLFVYRMDKLDELGPQIAEFLGRAKLEILKTNDTSESQNSEKYRKFTKHYQYDPALVEALVSTRYVQTFFSPDEIAALKARWVNADRGGKTGLGQK